MGLVVLHNITSPKNGTDIHLKWHLSLFSFRLTSLHLCSTFCTISSWSLPFSSYPTTKMSPAMPKTFGMSWQISLIFCWNISPAGAAPNGSHLYLYLPNWQTNVVRYDAFSSSLKLCYLELASRSERYLMLSNFGNISFSVGPMCIGLISAWFNHARSRHGLTIPLALGTNTKLLHHSDISLTPRDAIMSCCCSLSNSSWNGFCSAYAMCLGGAWYGLLSGLSCKENVPSKQPMPLNTSSKSLCICCVDSALFLCHYYSLDL